MERSKRSDASEEALAYRAGLDAFLQAFVKELKGTSVASILGTSHEHVAVLNLALEAGGSSLGVGLKVNVRISFDPKLVTPAEMEALATLRGPS